jgi:hypothetical protein
MLYDKLNKTWYKVAALILLKEKDWQYVGGNFDTVEQAQEYIEKDKNSAIPFHKYKIIEHTSQII